MVVLGGALLAPSAYAAENQDCCLCSGSGQKSVWAKKLPRSVPRPKSSGQNPGKAQSGSGQSGKKAHRADALRWPKLLQRAWP